MDAWKLEDDPFLFKKVPAFFRSLDVLVSQGVLNVEESETLVEAVLDTAYG